MKMDYFLVQNHLDQGKTKQEVQEIFGITKGQWDNAKWRGLIQWNKESALETYMRNPSTCLFCKAIIIPKDKTKNGNHVQAARVKKFCNHSCSARYNNSLRQRFCENCKTALIAPGRKRRFCSRLCYSEFKYRENISEWREGRKTGLSSRGLVKTFIKKYLREKFENKCAKCGWAEVNVKTGLVPLVADHIDGNWRNNTEGNLLLICPNCDATGPTYCALNRGNGRGSLRQEKIPYASLV